MVSETIPTGQRLRFHRDNVKGLATDVERSGQNLVTVVERVGKLLIFSQTPKYDLWMGDPHFDARDLPAWVGFLSPQGDSPQGSWGLHANPGYGSPFNASEMHVWRDVLPLGTSVHFFTHETRPGDIAANSSQSTLELVETIRHQYGFGVGSAQYGLNPEEVLSRYTSSFDRSIDEVIATINAMGEYRIAARLEYLASDDLLEDGDVPISLPVCAGFLDFLFHFTNDAYLNLTCAKGWLCTEWDFPDGSSVVLWFFDRDSARVTVFDGGGKVVDINAGQRVRDRRTIMNNLRQAEYFSWRNTHSTEVNSRPMTISPAIAPRRSSETMDDHLRLPL